MSKIRKLSVGSDYPNGCLHYQVGKSLSLGKGRYIITEIVLNKDMIKLGIKQYDIYISNGEDKVLWKDVDVPCVAEYDIDFE